MNAWRQRVLVGGCLAALVLPGCQGWGRTEGGPTPPVVSYEVVRKAYNSRTDNVKQLWARAVVELRWEDDEGSHFEQGDGPFILRKPMELALAIGKLGNVMFWLGCDPERFWLFELDPPKDRPRTAVVGRHEDVGKPGVEVLPIPVPPAYLMELMGIVSLPSEESGSVVMRSVPGAYQIEVEGGEGVGPRRRILVDPATSRPFRIQIEDEAGKLLAEANLSRYRPLTQQGVRSREWPELATRIDLNIPAQRAKIGIYISSVTDGRADNKVKDIQFDFDGLVSQFAPERVRVLKPREE